MSKHRIRDGKRKIKTQSLVQYDEEQASDSYPKLIKQKDSNDYFEDEIQNRQDRLNILIKRNERLKNCVYEVENLNKKLEEIEKQRKTANRSVLAGVSPSVPHLKKELEGVYQKMKNYESEIRKKEKKSISLGKNSVTSKIHKLDDRLQQQHQIKQKLKAELQQKKKAVTKISKQLHNKSFEQRDRKNTILLREIEILKAKVKEMEDSDRKKSMMLGKQAQFIKKLQEQLINDGISRQYLKDLLHKSTKNIKSETEQIRSSQKKKKINESPDKKNLKASKAKTEESKQQIKHISYKEYKHKIAILEKSIVEQAKQITKMKIEYMEEKQKNAERIQREKKLDEEIASVSIAVEEMRRKLPKIFQKGKNIGNESVKKMQKNKITDVRNKFNMLKTQSKLAKIDQNQEQKEEKKPIPEQIQFSDCQKIQSFQFQINRMTGIYVYLSPISICGIKVIYEAVQEGCLHIVRNQSQYEEQKFICTPNQYISNIIGQISQENKVVTSLTVMTSSHRYITLGKNQKQKGSQMFELAEDPLKLPVCLNGKMGPKGIVSLWADLADLQDFSFESESSGGVDKNELEKK